MKALNGFPPGTVGNCDFVTRRTKVEPGERVIDLQVSTNDLPVLGDRMVLHEGTVKMMVAKLGWELADPAEREKLERRLERLQSRCDAFERALMAANEELTDIPEEPAA